MPTYDTAKLRDLILATVPRNEGEADADYFARCTAAAQTVADAANADRRTVRAIRLDELRPLLASLGLLGNLALAAQSDATAANAYAYVNSANVTIRSDLADYAAQFDTMMTGLAAIGLTDAIKAQVIDLGGGYALRGATADDVTAEVAAMAREAAITALQTARAALDNDRKGKLAYLAEHPDADVPADLAGLDAWTLPAEGGGA